MKWSDLNLNPSRPDQGGDGTPSGWAGAVTGDRTYYRSVFWEPTFIPFVFVPGRRIGRWTDNHRGATAPCGARVLERLLDQIEGQDPEGYGFSNPNPYGGPMDHVQPTSRVAPKKKGREWRPFKFRPRPEPGRGHPITPGGGDGGGGGRGQAGYPITPNPGGLRFPGYPSTGGTGRPEPGPVPPQRRPGIPITGRRWLAWFIWKLRQALSGSFGGGSTGTAPTSLTGGTAMAQSTGPVGTST